MLHVTLLNKGVNQCAVKTRAQQRGVTEDQTPAVRTRHDDPQSGAGSSDTGGAALCTVSTQARIRNKSNTNPNDIPTSSNVGEQEAFPIPEVSNICRRTRFKWSEEMNAHLYRAFLYITHMETVKAPYGHRLQEEMLRRFPELQGKTMQNILDQRRQLFTKRRLPPDLVSTIRQEVAEELGMVAPNIVNNQPPPEHQPPERLIEIITDQDEKTAYEALQGNILLYKGLNPNKRPRIPKLKTSRKTNEIINHINNALKRTLQDCEEISILHDYIYAAAVTIIELHGQNIQQPQKTKSKSRQPVWQTRLKNKISGIRKEIGVLTQYTILEKNRDKVERKAKNIIDKHKNETNKTVLEIVDYLKQKLSIYANRLRRYKVAYQRRIDNRLFQNNQRAFYRKIQNPEKCDNNLIPTIEDTHKFWSDTWGKTTTHNSNATWLKQERKKMDKIKYMSTQNITTDNVREALRGTHNWKAAGPDKIHNFWYKKLTCTHEKLAAMFNEILKQPELMPAFLTQGNTFLLPKTTPSVNDPSKYRPITCLPTLYKLLTSIISNKIYKHMTTNNLLAEEQKGCRRQTQGSKEQLVIDTVVTEHAKRKRKDLHIAFIDYQKAFDSVPHSWLLECLQIYKVDPQIINLLSNMMLSWRTNIDASNQDSEAIIYIKRGIFQGDALSALWFCIALNPLSTALNDKGDGYQIGPETINHLMYMDDIKLISDTTTGLKRLLRTTEEFSYDIKMKFGLEKCKTNHFSKGKWQQHEDYTLLKKSGNGTITAMNRHESYKYLGITQSQGIDNAAMKQQLRGTLKTRLRAILKTQLSAINIAKAVNSFVIPAVAYSFGVVKWTPTDLEELNREIRTGFTQHRAHHPKACKERFHLPRDMGGRGITDLRLTHKNQIRGLRSYFHKRTPGSTLYSAIVEADTKLTPLDLSNRQLKGTEEYSIDNQINNWQAKELHGRYANTLEQTHIDKKASVAWLTEGSLFVETEGFMTAIQDQVMATRSYLAYIIKDASIATTKCRMCGTYNETIEHIISGCPVLAPKDYINRHNNVAKIIHSELSLRYGYIKDRSPYYKYDPPQILENEECKIYWDRGILTDRKVQNNRPDICLLDKKESKVTLIDVAIPAPVNIFKKHKEKTDKYSPLATEIKQLWKVKQVEIIPIIIGATGEIPKQLLQNLKNMNFPKNIHMSMQKPVILGTCNIVRRVLNIPR